MCRLTSRPEAHGPQATLVSLPKMGEGSEGARSRNVQYTMLVTFLWP